LVEKSLNRQFGTICAVTGGGKTVMGNYIISQRKQPTLVMVRTERLARQWVEEVEKFLGVPKEQVGFIGDGRVDIAPHITIGIIPTLFKNVDKIKHHFGFVICDEVHRIVARTFAEVIGKLDTKFMLGLSATFKRRDGLHPLIHWYIGDMVASVSRDEVETRGKVMKPHIILRFTNFYSKLNDPTWQRADLITEIINDPKRNRMIMRDLSIDLANNPGILMVMTERQEHCEILNYLFNSNGLDSTYIHGGLPTKQKDSIMQELKEGKIKILIATDALLGEGFDCPEITSLFLTTPISFETRLIQVVGRALRYHEGKITPKVYDYQDLFVDVLERAALNRNRLYKKIADNPQDVCRGKKK
jgi:superfamily II DNA or RNA helicase